MCSHNFPVFPYPCRISPVLTAPAGFAAGCLPCAGQAELHLRLLRQDAPRRRGQGICRNVPTCLWQQSRGPWTTRSTLGRCPSCSICTLHASSLLHLCFRSLSVLGAALCTEGFWLAHEAIPGDRARGNKRKADESHHVE